MYDVMLRVLHIYHLCHLLLGMFWTFFECIFIPLRAKSTFLIFSGQD